MSREDAAAPACHSSTTQWQSFEMRMRRRRVERCVLRAEAALEAGNSEDARAAVEEARLLDASVPEFETLHAAVVERQQAARHDRVRRGRRLAFAAALLVAAASGVAVWQRVSSPLAPVAEATTGVTVPPPQVTPAPIQPQSADLEVVPARSELGDSSKPVSAGAQEPVLTPEFSPASFTTPVVGREVEIAVPALPASERITPDLGTPVPGLPEPPLPAVAAPPPVASRTADATPAVDEGARVRAALTQYELAYSGLNVSAAQAIWPAVDARALARAFEGLESQRVSLGSCSVAIDGASARADCNGMATWTPKIGGGTNTEPRHWRFELKNVSGQWQIVRADVR